MKSVIGLTWCFFVVVHMTCAAESLHPLLPLTEAELNRSVDLICAGHGKRGELLFPMLALQEPTKQELHGLAAGKSVPRRASAVVLDRQARRSYEATVDLAAGKLTSWQELPGIHPTVLLEEYERVANIVRADPLWQAAMKKRGIEKFEQVNLDGWAPGFLSVPGAETARLMRVLSFYRGEGVNAYGRPVEGVIALVNLDTGKVQQLVDTGVVPVSNDPGTDFFAKNNIPPRSVPKPLLISQPEGPSFEVEGNEIRWQKWRFRYSLHPREGLVLHTIGYEEKEKVRSILHRASVAEMVVPYGDAAANWNWRSAFDQGEYGLGRTCNSLILGQDVPANARLFDTTFVDDYGQPYTKPTSVAIYEQDGGVLWKHYDETSGKVAIRRARQLVIGTVTTVGNYDYGLNWIFHQDGTLEARVDLTGILLVKGVVPQKCEKCAAVERGATGEAKGDQRYGTLVGKSVVAANHQHIFSFRLDFDIDGSGNSVVETSVKPAPAGPDNPAANAFVHLETPLRTEREARRNLNLQEHRRWKVYNPTVTNDLGHFSGYLLEPGSNCVPKLGPTSIIRKRAGYIDHHLWVTQQKDKELHAAGDYPRQRAAGEGLPQWSGDESLEKQDLVMWYTMTVTHVPRAEEWPVMSAAHSGFSLVPAGFFAQNPALDVPDSVPKTEP
ncbi:Copper methylamine oxidase precursor [Anatilimnocola aggregata]|uniref:Amine oxidase n=1 Tax=Anatilimnocola aggregata TaxID=2528021 RepID=A0A517YD84_9BACT|nr:primary-amine oxidase [Anatilimnocola aggregata]QDU28149.1 Copper methylamine oxidase precursor [Anatilimnocola aggregata]